MRRTYERGTKARGGLHAPVNMADSMEEVMLVEKRKRRKWHASCAVHRYISYAKFSHILDEVLRDFHRLFGSGKSPATDIRHVRHGPPEKLSLALVPRSYVPAAHDCGRLAY